MTCTVVHFVDSLSFGGSEKALLLLLEGLDRKLWEPVLFYHDRPGMLPLRDEAQRLDIRTVEVPVMRGSGVFSAFPLFLGRLRRERPDVFHAHLNWLLSCKYGLLAAALLRVPAVIATAHQYMLPPWGRTVYGQQQVIKRCVDQYVAVSDAIAFQLCQTFGVQPGQIRVIHNSVSLDLFEIPNHQKILRAFSDGKKRPVVMTVARLDPQKGHTYLLKAIRQIPEALFVFVGSGQEKPALVAEANELGIADRVIFTGFREDIPDLLASCNFVVLPSIYEGLPISVLEAMAAGKAVVATAVGGTPEVVMDGKTGFLVPPRDPSALAQAIRKLLDDSKLADEMGAAGKCRVKREFSSDSMLRWISHTYEEVLNSKLKGKNGRSG